MRIAGALILFCAATAAAAAPPRVQPLSIPRAVVVGAPWRAVVSVRPAARATLEARGTTTLRAKLVRTARPATYAATLRFPTVGTWSINAIAGGRRARLGTVRVSIARSPLLVDPFAIAVEPGGTVLVGNLRQGSLVRFEPGGRATTVVDRTIGSLTVSPQGTIYALTDQALFRLEGRALVRVAGTGQFTHSGDGGHALEASFAGVTSAAVDAAGNIYVAEFEGWIRRIDPSGTITTIAGTGEEGFSGDGGLAVSATFNRPHGLSVGPDSALYVADAENRRVRRIDLATGRVSTFSEVGTAVALAVAPDGTVYVANDPKGGGGGVTATSPSGGVTRLYNGDANNLAPAADGTLYVVSNRTKTIFRLDPRTRRTEPVARG